MKKKLFSLLMMVAMVLTALLPFSKIAFAAEPHKTTVYVHKILADGGFNDEYYTNFNSTGANSENKEGVAEGNAKYDATNKLTEGTISKFGTNGAKLIDKVFFLAVPTKSDNTAIYTTLFGDGVEALPKGAENLIKAGSINDYLNMVNNGKTYNYGGLIENAQNGLGLVLPDGDYKIFEIKARSEYRGKDNNVLEKTKAIPVELSLPYTGANGKIADELHVYPKNTENKPNIDKDVTAITNKADTVKVGDYVTWYITVDVPADIKDYQIFSVTDTMTKGLQFKAGSLKVLEYDGTKPNKLGAEVPVTDYTLTQPLKGNDLEFEVNFIKENNRVTKNFEKYAGKKIVIEYQSLITKDAENKLGQAIPNDVKLDYGHNPKDKGENKPKDFPEVHTGGKKFIKVDPKIKEGEAGRNLSGAEFRIANEENGKKFLAKNDKGETAWLEEEGNGYTFVTLTSKSDGTFEIKGLAYGKSPELNEDGSLKNPGEKFDTNSKTTYYLKEIKAPSGYALNEDYIKFEVGKDTYNDTDSKAWMQIDNKKQDIPQTGGIGTVVFTAVGLLLMVTSFVALRRRASHSK